MELGLRSARPIGGAFSSGRASLEASYVYALFACGTNNLPRARTCATRAHRPGPAARHRRSGRHDLARRLSENGLHPLHSKFGHDTADQRSRMLHDLDRIIVFNPERGHERFINLRTPSRCRPARLRLAPDAGRSQGHGTGASNFHLGSARLLKNRVSGCENSMSLGRMKKRPRACGYR